MTKKFKKRSLSESNVTEKSGNKDTNNTPVSPKKLKVDAVPDAQSNVASKKIKKGAQGDANVNKKKQDKNKNENNVKKVTPTVVAKEKDANQSNQKPASQEGSLNRKERNKLKKAENNKLSKEKRKMFRREEGNAKTKTALLSPEQLQERIKELESRETLTKTAKKKLAVFKKLLQVQEGTTNKNTSETTNSAVVSKKQDKKRSLEEVSGENKAEKKVKLGKTLSKGVNENDTKSSTTQSANKQNSAKQKNAKVQPGSLLRVKPKKDEDEEDDESSGDDDTENEVKPSKEVSEDDVEEEEDDDDDDDDDDEAEEEDEDDNEEGENKNEVESTDDEEGEEEEKENEDDEEENEDEGTDKALKKTKKEKKKGSETTNNKNQGAKKKRYIVYVSNIPFSSNAGQIREHFLTKVSKISDVRIPKTKGTSKVRGFCYVELENREDYEKALSLHHTFLDSRRINVEYSPSPNNTNAKQLIVAKNKKLDALRKEGKLAGSKKKTDKKVKKGKQNAVSTTA